jgi:hypothetical protein
MLSVQPTGVASERALTGWVWTTLSMISWAVFFLLALVSVTS